MRLAETAVVDERCNRSVTNAVKQVAAHGPARLFSRASADADFHQDRCAAHQIDGASIGGDEKTIRNNSIAVHRCS
jgi:hypothetical protein